MTGRTSFVGERTRRGFAVPLLQVACDRVDDPPVKKIEKVDDCPYEVAEAVDQVEGGDAVLRATFDEKYVLVHVQAKAGLRGGDEKVFRRATERFLNFRVENAAVTVENVVGLLRCFETPEAYHLVFEEGEAWSEDLPSLLGNGWNAQEIAKGLIFGLLRGLEALHAQGVVHKDLRAEHILVSNRDGAVTVRLSSHWAELPPSTPSMKKVIGSDGLQAPEVYRGEVCYASDCFAAGILWFLLIENRDPFPAECFATLRPGLFPGSAPMVAAAEAIEAHALGFSDQLWDPRAASLCTRLLCVDPVMRTTAAEALVDPYFADGE